MIYEKKVKPYLDHKPNGCIGWTKSSNGKTPYFYVTRTKKQYVARYLYEREHGELPDYARTRRSEGCTDPTCVNPDHVYAITEEKRKLNELDSKYHRDLYQKDAEKFDVKRHIKAKKQLQQELEAWKAEQVKTETKISHQATTAAIMAKIRRQDDASPHGEVEKRETDNASALHAGAADDQ